LPRSVSCQLFAVCNEPPRTHPGLTVGTHLGSLLSPTDDTLLQRMVRDNATSDDLLQEVFLRVWERTAQFSGSGTARSWLYRIASNLALNHLDAVKRRRQQSLEPLADDDGDSPLPAWLVDEAAIAPDAALKKLELQRLVARCRRHIAREQTACRQPGLRCQSGDLGGGRKTGGSTASPLVRCCRHHHHRHSCRPASMRPGSS